METDEQFFHGPNYTSESWNTKYHTCCKLCKTKNSKLNRTRHWSRGLCRSCYRRLNFKHRLYNDSYNNKAEDENSSKKEYKLLDNLSTLSFDDLDVETLLERYEWQCAYSGTKLQGYSHKRRDAFQLEYLVRDGQLHLVPICRSCNCSKKNLTTPEDIKKWCESKEYPYPVRIITLGDYLNS